MTELTDLEQAVLGKLLEGDNTVLATLREPLRSGGEAMGSTQFA